MSLTIFNLILALYVYSTFSTVNGLIGGREPKLNEVKYQVAVVSGSATAICGGGIIDDKYIITAAHCLRFNKKTKILQPTRVIASTNSTKRYYPETSIVKFVRRAFIPPTYEAGVSTASDIAVLELTGSLRVELNSNRLQKLELPNLKSFDPEIHTEYNNLNVVVAGYGQHKVKAEVDDKGIVTYKTSRAGTLHVANATVFDWYTCRKRFSATLNHRMCVKIAEDPAYGKYHGVCFGDSGSPVVYDGRIVLGVASSVNKCVNFPAIFVRTSSYLPFIRNAMNGTITEDMQVYTY